VNTSCKWKKKTSVCWSYSY